MTGCPDSVGQHQLRHGGAVKAEAVFAENIHDIGIGSGLDREILAETRIPGKGLLNSLRVFPDSFFIIEIKGSRILLRDLFRLFLCYIRDFFHNYLLST